MKVFVLNNSICLCELPPTKTAVLSTVQIQVLDANEPIFMHQFTWIDDSPVTISVQPTIAVMTGGTKLKVVGRNLHLMTDFLCHFGENEVSASRFISSTAVLCAVLPSQLGFTKLKLLPIPSNSIFESSEFFILRVAPAFITHLLPSRGSIKGGNQVTMYGKFYPSDLIDVFFGYKRAQIFSVSSGQLICEVPAFVGFETVPVRVSTDGHVLDVMSAEIQYIYEFSNATISLIPTFGPTQGGSRVILNNFQVSSAINISCRFGAVLAAVRCGVSSCFCISPPALPGKVPFVLVETEISKDIYRNGSTLLFLFRKNPEIFSVAPNLYSAMGSTILFVHGNGFYLNDQATCYFNNMTAPASVISSTRVACATPVVAGLFVLSIELDGGLVAIGRLQARSFLPLNFAKLHPKHGHPGSLVWLYGSFNLTADPFHDLRCKFGPVFTTMLGFLSSTKIFCTVPYIPPGNYSVEIVIGKNLFSKNAHSFHILDNIVVQQILPSMGYSGVDLVKIYGLGITGDKSLNCMFGNLSARVSQFHKNAVTCKVPTTKPGLVLFYLNSSHQSVLMGRFYFMILDRETRVYDIRPTKGPVQGGTLITVVGQHFLEQHLQCMFGNFQSLAIIFHSSSRVDCSSPSNFAGYVEFRILQAKFVVPGSERRFDFVESIALWSVLPSFAYVFGGNMITLHGSHFLTDEIFCKFGNSLAASCTLLSSEYALCLVPQNREGVVLLRIGSSPAEYFKGNVPFEYLGTPKVYFLLPSKGSKLGGSIIRAFGSNFAQTTYCRFGTAEHTQASFSSSTSIQCISPASKLVGKTRLTFYTPGLDKTFSSVYDFQYVEEVTVISISPSSGTVSGGSYLQIVGYHFCGESVKCAFGDESYSEGKIISSTLVICISPAWTASGYVNIELSLDDQEYTQNRIPYLYTTPPLIYSLVPSVTYFNSVLTITIFGTGFACPHCDCALGTELINTVTCSVTIVTCTFSSIPPGNWSVRTSNNQMDYSNSISLLIQEEITLQALQPSIAPASGGALISIKGTGFSIQTNFSCIFGSVTVVGALQGSSTISCVAPPSSIERIKFSLMIVSSDFQIKSKTMDFFYWTPLTPISAYPSFGPVLGGTSVTISGFALLSSALVCCFGQLKSMLVVVSNTMVSCVSPRKRDVLYSSNLSSIPLRLSFDGTCHENALLLVEFSYSSVLQILSLKPATVFLGWFGTVELNGTGFLIEEVIVIYFGEFRVTCEAVSVTQALCPLTIFSKEMTSISLHGNKVHMALPKFVILDRPNPVSLDPTIGSSARSVILTVFGSGFSGLLDLHCKFDAIFVLTKILTSSRLKCVAPPHPAGFAKMEILDKLLNFSFFATLFQFVDEVSISEIFPSSGPLSGGTAVSFSGSNFFGALCCRFGSSRMIPARTISSTLIVCSSEKQYHEGYVQVEMSRKGEDIAFGNTIYLYERTATIYSVIPSSGFGIGSETLVLFGSHFGRSEEFTVKFGENFFSTSSWISSSQASCISPRTGSYANFTLFVSNNGQDFSISNARYVLLEFGSVSISPTHGPCGGGTVVTIRMENCRDFETCLFGSQAVYLVVGTDSTCSCVAPSFQQNTCENSFVVEFGLIGALGARAAKPSNLYFQYDQVIRAFSLQPTVGSELSKFSVTVFGSGFMNSNFLSCKLNFFQFPATFVSSTSIFCRISLVKIVPFLVMLYLSNNGLDFSNTNLQFAVVKHLKTLRMVPADFIEKQAVSTFTLLSDSFPPLEALYCKIGSKFLSLGTFLHSSTQLVCNLPELSPGNYSVQVSVGEDLLISRSVNLTLRIHSAIEIVRIFPSVGPAFGGTEVVVTGTAFLSNILVLFGNISCITTVSSTTRIRVVSPPHQAGPVNLMLSTNLSPGTFTRGIMPFLYLDATALPIITKVVPSRGPIFGDILFTVHGNHFQSDSTCLFGSLYVSTEFVNSHMIYCSSLRLLDSDQVTLIIYSETQNTFTNGVSVLQFGNPSVSSILPTSGCFKNIEFLTIFGSNFQNHGVSCRVGGNWNVPAVMLTNTAVKCFVGGISDYHAHLEVEILYDSFLVGTVPQFFHAHRIPRIFKLFPTHGPTFGGSQVSIHGLSFEHDTVLCSFGLVQIRAEMISSSLFSCLSPVLQPSLVNFRIWTSEWCSSDCVQKFTYEVKSPVFIFETIPSIITTNAGLMITFIGAGFEPKSQDYKCRIGLSSETTIICISHSLAICSSTSVSIGTFRVTVHVDGIDYTGNLMNIYYAPAPTLISVLPHPVRSTGVLMVLGSHFENTGRTTCKIGRISQRAVVLSSTRVHCEALGVMPGNKSLLISPDENLL